MTLPSSQLYNHRRFWASYFWQLLSWITCVCSLSNRRRICHLTTACKVWTVWCCCFFFFPFSRYNQYLCSYAHVPGEEHELRLTWYSASIELAFLAATWLWGAVHTASEGRHTRHSFPAPEHCLSSPRESFWFKTLFFFLFCLNNPVRIIIFYLYCDLWKQGKKHPSTKEL